MQMSFKEELLEKIINELQMEDIEAKDVDYDAELFGEDGLGLDSLDAVELVVILKKFYNVHISDMVKGKEAFKSINTLAAFIENELK